MLSQLYTPHIGGVERHMQNLNKILVEKRCNVTVITEKFDERLKNRISIDRVEVIRFKHLKIKFLGLFLIWFSLLKKIRIINQADIVHIHDVFVWYLPFRFLFPRKPVYITFHGYPSYPLSKKAIFYQKIAEKLTRGNICIGDFITKWFGTKPSIISYGAVNLKKFKPFSVNSFKYDAIFSSRLDKQTGILLYIKTIRILKKKGINFKLLVLGNGKYRKEAERYSTCKGFVSDPSPYFKQARFAFVSRFLAIMEAFASKKLVFAVYDDSLKEDYLKMSPFSKWIIIEKNPEKLANKIEFYMNNMDKARPLIDSAYKWVKGQTWEKMAGNYLELWGIK